MQPGGTVPLLHYTCREDINLTTAFCRLQIRSREVWPLLLFTAESHLPPLNDVRNPQVISGEKLPAALCSALIYSGESNLSTAIPAGSQITTLNNAALSQIWKSEEKKNLGSSNHPSRNNQTKITHGVKFHIISVNSIGRYFMVIQRPRAQRAPFWWKIGVWKFVRLSLDEVGYSAVSDSAVSNSAHCFKG